MAKRGSPNRGNPNRQPTRMSSAIKQNIMASNASHGLTRYPSTKGRGGAFNDEQDYFFYFNGTSQWADFATPFRVRGYPFTLEYDCTPYEYPPAGFDQRVVLDAGNYPQTGIVLNAGEGLQGHPFAQYVDIDNADVDDLRVDVDTILGEQHSVKLEMLATETNLISSIGSTLGAQVAAIDPRVVGGGIQRISADINEPTPAIFPWVGIIKNIRMTAGWPIQGGTYMVPDGTQRGDLGADIPITDSFDISFDWVREPQEGVSDDGNSFLLGDATADTAIIAADKSRSTAPDGLEIGIGGVGAAFPNALANVNYGNHINIRLYRDGAAGVGEIHCEIDGVDIPGVVVDGPGNGVINTIGGVDGQPRYKGTLANLKISSNGLDWHYPLTEEPVDPTLIRNIGSTGAAFNGVWNGVVDWTYYPTESRFYPMDEGSGDIFSDTIQDLLNPSDHTATIHKPLDGGGGWNWNGDDEQDYFYYFNGTSQHVSIPDWTPRGFPFTVSAVTDKGVGAPVYNVLAATNANNGFQAFGFALTVSEDDTGAAIGPNWGAPDLFIERDWSMTVTPTEVIPLLSDATANPVGPYLGNMAAADAPVYTTIGAGDALDANFTGIIKDVYLTDNSPIQGREYWTGTSTNQEFGKLNDPIAIAAGTDYTLSFDWVREDFNGTGTNQVISLAGVSNSFQIRLFDSANGSNPNNISLSMGGSQAVWPGALAHVAQGQHINIQLVRDSGDTETRLLIDHVAATGRTGNTLMTQGGSFDTIGASDTGGNNLSGAIANLEVTCTAPAPATRGFLPYGSGHPDIVDEFLGTSINDMGLCVTDLFGRELSYSDKGFNNTLNDGFGASWDVAVNAPDLITNGYTVQFDLEKSFFAEVYTGADYAALFASNISSGGQSFKRSAVNSNIDYAIDNEASVDGLGFKTVSDGYDEYVTVNIVLDPTAGAGGTFYFYANSFLLYSVERQLTGAITTILLAPAFVYDVMPERIRNVTIFDGPLDPTVSAKTITTLGNSFTQWGQYQSGNADDSGTADPFNNPSFVGYDGAGGASGAEDTAAFYQYKNGSFHAYLHDELAKKNTSCARIDFMGRGGSCILNNVIARPLSDRVDTALGLPGRYPTGGAGSYDYWVIEVGYNDIELNIFIDNGATWDTYLANCVVELQTQIARMVNDGGAEVVVLCSQPAPVEDATPLRISMTNELNAMYADLDGYMGVVRYAPWGADYSEADTDPDNIHPNSVGQRKWADGVGAVLPNLNLTGEQTYTYPLEREADNDLYINNTDPVTGSAFNGEWNAENWTPIERNNRIYKIDDGSGTVISDTGQPGGADGTLVGDDDAGGGWNFTP